jgi:glutaredoxin
MFNFPSQRGYTIYTKKQCVYCDRAKELLQNETITLYSCDDIEYRDDFLIHMDTITGKIHRTFPFIFHNGVFIGGYDDTVQYYQSQLSFTSDF